MKIYTKTGDDGTTGLFGGSRVGKDDELVEAYGTVDEANAAIGLARATEPAGALDTLLASVQGDLFVLGAELACVPEKRHNLKLTLIETADIERLERAIDTNEQGLPALKNFILPGGSRTAAALHAARTVCRRAERRTLTASRRVELRPELLVYLNRLSDLLFVLARRANYDAGVADVPWVTR
jgi:cob(I)alamin adenosyltransferase